MFTVVTVNQYWSLLSIVKCATRLSLLNLCVHQYYFSNDGCRTNLLTGKDVQLSTEIEQDQLRPMCIKHTLQ